MLAFTIAHLSICVLRYREPERAAAVPDPGRRSACAAASLPVPAVLGALLSGAGMDHGDRAARRRPLRRARVARSSASALYVVYRTREGKPVRARVTVPEQVLRAARERDFGSILVPLVGGELDEDLVQTAALLVSGEPDETAIDTATIEAVWIFRVPMSLPLDAPLPEAQLARGARRARARQARRRGVHRRRGRDRDRALAADRRGDRRGGAPARRRGDRARRRRGLPQRAPGRSSADARSSARARSRRRSATSSSAPRAG